MINIFIHMKKRCVYSDFYQLSTLSTRLFTFLVIYRVDFYVDKAVDITF